MTASPRMASSEDVERELAPAAATAGVAAGASDGRAALDRLRHGLGRIRSAAGERPARRGRGDERDLRVEAMLLREENARLKAVRHHRTDISTLNGRLQDLALERSEAETAEDASSLLTELLVVREGLEQACVEIETAIGDVHERLRRLGSALGRSAVADGAARRARVEPSAATNASPAEAALVPSPGIDPSLHEALTDLHTYVLLLDAERSRVHARADELGSSEPGSVQRAELEQRAVEIDGELEALRTMITKLRDYAGGAGDRGGPSTRGRRALRERQPGSGSPPGA